MAAVNIPNYTIPSELQSRIQLYVAEVLNLNMFKSVIQDLLRAVCAGLSQVSPSSLGITVDDVVIDIDFLSAISGVSATLLPWIDYQAIMSQVRDYDTRPGNTLSEVVALCDPLASGMEWCYPHYILGLLTALEEQ